MNELLFYTGLLLMVFTAADLLYTSFSARGAGLITGTTTRALWIFLVQLSRWFQFPKLLNYAGLLVVCYTLAQWVVLAWVTNFLIVLSDTQSILNAQTKLPASAMEKLYTVGYTFSTMGNGDYIGASPGSKIYLSVLAVMGLIMITVALTYLVQVLSSVTSKRVFAGSVSSMGATPEQLLLNAWNGEDLSSLNQHLVQLSTQVTTLGEHHLAYPVLHYYYVNDRQKSLPVAVALLDEALTIIYTAVPRQHWPNSLTLHATRQAIADLLAILRQGFIQTHKEEPPLPSFALLREQSFPLVPVEKYKAAYAAQEERRKLLRGWLKDEGREWEVVNDMTQ